MSSQLDGLWEANADYARSIGFSGESTRTLLYLFALRFLSTQDRVAEEIWREVRIRQGRFSGNLGLAREMLQKLAHGIERRFPELEHVFTQQLPLGLGSADSLLDRWVRDLDTLGSSVKVTSAGFGQWFNRMCEAITVGSAEGFQFATPRPLAELIVRLADPTASECVHDPCAGIGTILAAAAIRIGSPGCSGALSGQEIQPGVVALARLRLFLLGADEVRIRRGDVIRHPEFVQCVEVTDSFGKTRLTKGNDLETFDVVLCDPPYGQRFGDTHFAEFDPYRRFMYGRPGRTSGDMAFVQHAVACLKPHGRAITLIPHGPLFRSGADVAIRTNMIEDDVIDAVIGLPAGMLPGLSLELALLLCRRSKKETGRAGQVLFIDASQRREALETSSKWESLADEIVSIHATNADVPSFSRVVTRAEIERNLFSLQPRRYISQEDQMPCIDVRATLADAARHERDAMSHAEIMEQLLEQLSGAK